MSKNFLSLKKKILLGAIIKAVLLGLSIGLPVASAIALVQKLTSGVIDVGLCCLVGIPLFLAVGGLNFLICYPTEKRIAKQLDGQLALNEKVQTMLAYKDNRGAIFQLQRDDTEKALTGAKVKGIDIKSIILCTVFILIGIGLLVGAIAIPYEEPEPPVIPVVPFEITELQIVAIEELIEYVNASEMDNPYKENVSTALTTMLDELKLVTNTEQRDEVLAKAIDAMYEQTDLSSSAVEIIDELWKKNTTSSKALAKALNYYDWPKLDEWDKFVSKIADFRSTLAYMENDKELDAQKQLEETKALLALTSDNITSALLLAEADSESGLYIVLTRLAKANETNSEFGTRVYGLLTLSELITEMGYKDTQRELDATLTALNSEIFKELSQHSINTTTGEYAMTRVCALFSYELPRFERPSLFEAESGDGSGSDSEGGGASGGIGSGTEYGSDDLVYDPYTGKYVEYGVILDKYYALMFGKLQGEDYTEEEKVAMEKYFDILYSGFGENEENNENNEEEN